jgi:hypothetical protein
MRKWLTVFAASLESAETKIFLQKGADALISLAMLEGGEALGFPLQMVLKSVSIMIDNQ